MFQTWKMLTPFETNSVTSFYLDQQSVWQHVLVVFVPQLCVGSTEGRRVFKVTLRTMKRSFLHWEPRWFTTSFLWWQSHQNMCQVVEQEWWCPAQEGKTLLKESPCFYKTEKNTSSVVLPLAWPHRALYMCILTSDRRTKQGIHHYCWHSLVKVMLEMLS